MMVSNVQGAALCQQFLDEINCGIGNCSALCLQKWKGNGVCVKTNTDALRCICYYPCPA